MSKTPRIRYDACRVCGCTDDRACEVGCSWVKTESRDKINPDPVPPLCSACAGTPADMQEALRRIASLSRRRNGGFEVVDEAARIARAAIRRFKQRGETADA